MYTDWRYLSYYTLGFLPSIFFGSRFIIQWIKSEKERKSYVNKAFWYLSLFGNCLLSIHYFVQIQYPLFLIQTINGFISWRNINLLSKTATKPFKLSVVILASTVTLSSLLFFIQTKFIATDIRFFEIPFALIDHTKSHNIPLLWHLFGTFGCFLFGIRAWFKNRPF